MSGSRDAVVVDLDGTIADTAADLCAALNHVLAGEGRPPMALAEMRPMVGDGARKLIERGLAASGPEPGAAEVEARLPAFLDYYASHLAVHSAPYPGVCQTLAGLAAEGRRLGVCTNKPEALSRRLLDALDLASCFQAVLGGDSLEVRKPDARHLLGVLEALGAAPGEAVMVGDSRNDVACARAAGVPVIAVAYGYSPLPAEELGADLVIARFDELPAALARLA